MARIEIDNVSKNFGSTSVLKDIDLTLENGEFVVLLGPSGCGKSTLLRMVAGLEDVTSGEIRFDGKRVDQLSAQARNVAMVFQSYALYPHMSVQDNLGYGLRIRGADLATRQRKTNAAATMLGIEEFLARQPRHLSGGQRQRVAMGRAMVREPVAFLFDEPLSNLDAKLRGQMRREIKQLQRSLGTTALYVTHDQIEAMTLADRVAVLNGGRIEQLAAPLDLYAKPQTLFVADFVGSHPMNLVDAIFAENGGMHAFGQIWPRPNGVPDALETSSGRYVLGVRPEHLEPVSTGDLTVSYIEPLGSETTFRLSDGQDDILVRAEPSVLLTEGERLGVTAAPANLHLFDGETGMRLNS